MILYQLNLIQLSKQERIENLINTILIFSLKLKTKTVYYVFTYKNKYENKIVLSVRDSFYPDFLDI